MKDAISCGIVKNIFGTATCWVVLISCHKATPVGFWLNFRKDLLVNTKSDQGPYGGRREIFWKSNRGNTFSSQEFFEFANKNGWRFKDSVFIPLERLKNWTNNNTFPFTYSQFSDSSVVEVGFSIWIEEDMVLYRFSTGWIAVEPGDSKETNKNGYIVFNPERSQVAVYQLWGE